MTSEQEKAKERFVAVGDGISIDRENPIPDWKSIFKKIEKKGGENNVSRIQKQPRRGAEGKR